MEQLGPWGLCMGIFCIWPGLLFGLGFYLGRNGSPVEIRWKGGRHDNLDDYEL